MKSLARVLCVLLVATAWSLGVADPPALSVENIHDTGTDARFLGQIRFELDGLDAAMKVSGFNPHSLRLFINGREITDSKGVILDARAGIVEFPVRRATADQQAWSELAGSPPMTGKRTFVVGAGTAGGNEFPYSSATKPTLEFRISGELIWLAGIGAVGLVVLAVLLAIYTDVVRDSVPANLAAGQRRPYSLAKCQIGFWLLLVTTAFLFVWTSTGDYNGIITADALVLLGISAGTGVVAVSVDAGKTLPAGANWPVSEGCFKDILTDRNGVTWYRFQNAIWTVILGVVFIAAVYQTLQLPSFDSKLLLMMGISGGLYAGFKWPEKQV